MISSSYWCSLSDFGACLTYTELYSSEFSPSYVAVLPLCFILTGGALKISIATPEKSLEILRGNLIETMKLLTLESFFWWEGDKKKISIFASQAAHQASASVSVAERNREKLQPDGPQLACMQTWPWGVGSSNQNAFHGMMMIIIIRTITVTMTTIAITVAVAIVKMVAITVTMMMNGSNVYYFPRTVHQKA